MTVTDLDRQAITTIRMLAADAVEAANSGHPGLPMGMAPAAFVLWTRFLRHDPSDPGWPDRDRFVLSAGHGSMLLYALLHLSATAFADRPSLVAVRTTIGDGPVRTGCAPALGRGTAPRPATPVATRVASGAALRSLAERLPELVGGSADLASSTDTALPCDGDGPEPAHGAVRAGRYGGRTINFGVREHAMGAALNGMALHGGLRPFGSTFLVFSDYMRPSVRLAALMGLPVLYVLTHDSIAVGEDGPTHQPVEHLAVREYGFHTEAVADAALELVAAVHA